METKICRTCKIEKSVNDFHFTRKDNYYCLDCKVCHCAIKREMRKSGKWLKTERNKNVSEQQREKVKQKRLADRQNINYKEFQKKKFRAQDAARRAIKKGVISRSETCHSCGKEKKTDAHHDDYDRPLDVIFLCRSCHLALHANKKITQIILEEHRPG